MSEIKDGPMVTRENLFHLQVCVPADWTDDQVKEWANRAHLCGTTNGWTVHVHEEKDEFPVRVPCEGRAGYVHVMLDA